MEAELKSKHAQVLLLGTTGVISSKGCPSPKEKLKVRCCFAVGDAVDTMGMVSQASHSQFQNLISLSQALQNRHSYSIAV